MALALWFAGLLGLVAAAIVASARARAAPTDVVARSVVAAVAAAYIGLVASAVWTWGASTAASARAARLRDGALVHLALDGVHVPLAHAVSIGHAADATLRIAGDGGELARVEPAAASADAKAPRDPIVRGPRLAAVRADQDAARVASARGCDAKSTAPLTTAAPAAADPNSAKSNAPLSTSPAVAVPPPAADDAFTIPRGTAVVAIECANGAPLRAAVIRALAPDQLLVEPLAFRGGRFAAEQLVARAGDALRLGGAADAIPGLTTWDLAAPSGASALLAVPPDPSDCAAWAPDPSTHAHASNSGCAVESGPFAVTALPLVPDADAVLARAAAAAAAIGAPPLALLLALALARRRNRRTRGLARALRLALLASGLVALVEWRLFWAYRIDILRDLAPHGARLTENQFAAVAIGAALAGLAALAHDAIAEAPLYQRALAALGAWAAWLGVGAVALGPADAFTASRTRAGVVALSLAAALLPLLAQLASRAARRAGPGVALAAIAAAATLARVAAPRATLCKLGLAYAFVLAAHGALRLALVRDTSLRDRVLGAVLLGAALLALGRYDAGVTLAIAGVGLALAMLVAGHDAAYDASQSARIGVLEREHARLLSVHGVAGAALAIGIAAVALSVDDRALIAHGASVAVHLPLVVAGLFALAAIIARSHRRGWAPWVCAALAAVAVWGARDALVERATAGGSVGARRVAAVMEPGYALLRDEHAFVANASAWREAALPRTADPDAWSGEGYFGARVRDLGVARSIDNDYLPVLVARETGIGGLTQTVALLLILAAAGGVIASVRLRHASRAHRARWLVTAVVGALCVYQPLASLGVLPLTGISWPGLGIDSPADLWLFVLGGAWCLLCDADGAEAVDDERVRRTARLRRARAIAAGAFGAAALAGVIVVARAGGSALGRVAAEDARIDEALRYAGTLTCAPERSAAAIGDALPTEIGGAPKDAGTERFDRELRAAWLRDRAALGAALANCADAPRGWTLAKDGEACSATSRVGLPRVKIRAERVSDAPIDDAPPAKAAARTGTHGADRTRGTAKATRVDKVPAKAPAAKPDEPSDASDATDDDPAAAASAPRTAMRVTCAVALSEDLIGSLRAPPRTARAPRIRVVSAPMGAAAADVGELIIGSRIVRLRPGAPAVDLATLPVGLTAASKVTLSGDAVLDVRTPPAPRGVALHGAAEIFVAQPGASSETAGWRRATRAPELVLERVTLVAAGPPEHRVVALFRPPREWPGAAPAVDALVADDTASVGDRPRRAYPYGAALPELGWVNPFDVEHSLGLDGWIHAALAPAHARNASPMACGTLAPPAPPRDRVCSPSPLDGVMECRVSLQPELDAKLDALAAQLLADPKALTGRATTPVRVAFVALRGDTGELIAQGNRVPGRPALAYAPTDAAAEANLIALREARGESDAERVEWNLPIAVGSTFKPIVARAAEEAFPQELALLSLTAAGHGSGCKAHHGVSVDTMLGHCPPASLAGNPSTADVHEFLAHSPNWYQAALGVLGLGLPSGSYSVRGEAVTLADIAASDLASWPSTEPLQISDAAGPILEGHSIALEGLRRAPLWRRIEALLGRPLCTLGDRARCEAAAERADVCAARALPVANASRDLRYLVALGPDQLDIYAEERSTKATVPIREYFQLLRGSGLHSIGSLAQLTDAFGRVIYDPSPGAPRLAASWFPAPAVGTTPAWSCSKSTGRTAAVVGADGGLCAVVQDAGTAHAHVASLLDDPNLTVYGAKTGTIDSLADIARKPKACRAWNERHVAAAQLDCGHTTPDDSLFVIAFGVATAHGVVPITLGIQLQRGGKGTAAHVTPAFVRAIADYLRAAP